MGRGGFFFSRVSWTRAFACYMCEISRKQRLCARLPISALALTDNYRRLYPAFQSSLGNNNNNDNQAWQS